MYVIVFVSFYLIDGFLILFYYLFILFYLIDCFLILIYYFILLIFTMRKASRVLNDPAWQGKVGGKKSKKLSEPETKASRTSDPRQAVNMRETNKLEFICDCRRTFGNAGALVNHKRACKPIGDEYSVSPGGRFKCICGRIYQTRRRWLDHFNRFCKREPQESNSNNFPCRFCDLMWPSLKSARQHERQKHPQECSQSLEEQASQPSKNKRWSDDEKRTMALLEKNYKESGLALKDLNSYLAAKLNRSVAAVHGMRARRPYKQLLANTAAVQSIPISPQNQRNDLIVKTPDSDNLSSEISPIDGQGQVISKEPSLVRKESISPLSDRWHTPVRGEGSGSEAEDFFTPPNTQSHLPSVESHPLHNNINGSSPPLTYLSPTIIDAATNQIIVTSRRSRAAIPRRANRTRKPPGDPDAIEVISSEIMNPEKSAAPQSCPPPMEDSFLTAISEAERKTKVKSLQGISSFLRTGNKEEIDTYLNNLLNVICPPRVKGIAKNPRAKSSTVPKKRKRTELFKRYQDLFRKNKKSLMQEVINGQTEDERTPTEGDIQQYFNDVFAEKSLPGNFKSEPKVRKNDTYFPLTPDEIQEALKGLNTAPGPDYISKTDMRKIDAHAWAIIYNVMLWKGVTPERLRASRTTLLHKKNDRTDPRNWRPITISSIIVRIFHKILAERLRNAVDLAEEQRGFCSIDGTMINSVLLETFFRESRQTLSNHYVASIDVQAAFDSVHHKSIEEALHRMGIEDQMVNYIVDHYRDLSTTIYCGKENMGQFKISTGVKQGDPLSPVIFNCVLDKFLSVLPTDLGGTIAGKKIPVLAFADDLLLLSNSSAAMQLKLDLLGKFLQSEGLRANINKCHILCCEKITGAHKMAVMTKSQFRLQGKLIPTVGAIDSFKYLGREIGFMGHQKPNCVKTLSQNLLSLQKAPLKPFQKMELLRTYLIPRFIYGFQNFKIEKSVLINADRLVRRFVRQTLHLQASLENVLIHAPEKDGGLGIFSFVESIPRILKSRLDKILEMPDFQYLKTSTVLMNIVGRISKLLCTPSSTKNSTFGDGLHQCSEDSASNSWIRFPPPFWTGYEYNAAHQLRTNSLPTRNQRGKPEHLRKCRAGCDKFETVCHILQACPKTHLPRIQRHNRVMKIVQEVAKERGFLTDMEPRIRDAAGELHIPDMVMKKGNTAIVVDANVPWESGHLTLAAQSKKAKYSKPLIEAAIRQRMDVVEVRHMPIIVGARGVWSRKANKEIEATLQFTAKVKRRIVTDVIQRGISIHRYFMRGSCGDSLRP